MLCNYLVANYAFRRPTGYGDVRHLQENHSEELRTFSLTDVLQRLQLAHARWLSVRMDLNNHLPRTDNGKYATFVLLNTLINILCNMYWLTYMIKVYGLSDAHSHEYHCGVAEQIAKLFVELVSKVQGTGVPRMVVFIRDPPFSSHLCPGLMPSDMD